VQPDFLREEAIEAGRLNDYKVLYMTDWCVSRAAAAQIDAWVKKGGVVYLSAGAATRDEFYEPYMPPFATQVWPENAANRLKVESHRYNERIDLPTLPPLAKAQIHVEGSPASFELPALGCLLPLRSDVANPFARFSDGSPAGTEAEYGKGKVIAVGFLPMLAYGQRAGFKPTTLEEKWPDAPRRLIQIALQTGHISPVAQCDQPVVETNLLTGSKGSVLVLVNYTYQPIHNLTVDLKLDYPISRASSTEGIELKFEKTDTGVRLHLPLEWTEMVVLE
jgi:hypothetical protein